MSDRITVSFSGMGLYQGCPSAFKRRYIDKEVLPERPVPLAMARGTHIHAGVEDYLNGDPVQIPDAAMSFEGLLEALKTERHCMSEVKFGLTEDWDIVPFDDTTAMVRGVLDGAYEHEGVAHVFEWKTGKWYDEHAKQRSLYALAGLALFPFCDRVVVQTVYFDLAKVEELELERKYMAAHQRIWKQRADEVQPPQGYKQTPNWKCKQKRKWCDYHVKNGGTCDGQPT